MKSYIPRTLNEVYDPERDVEAAQQGKSLIYSETIGIVDSNRKAEKVHFDDDVEGGSGEDEESIEDAEESGSDGEGGETKEDRKPRGHRHEDKEAKKVRCYLSDDVD